MKKVLLGAGLLVMLVCAGLQRKAVGITIGAVSMKSCFGEALLLSTPVLYQTTS